LPRLQELYTTYRDRGFTVIAVEAARDTDRAKDFISKKGITFLCLEDREEDPVVGGIFDVHSFPTSYLIDAEGRIMYYHLGFDDGDEKRIAGEIESLLGD